MREEEEGWDGWYRSCIPPRATEAIYLYSMARPHLIIYTALE